MKKDEAKHLIEYWAPRWVEEFWRQAHGDKDPSWSDFRSWIKARQPDILSFRTPTGSPEYFANLWFDKATAQSWKR